MYIYNMPLSFTMALAQQPRSAESFRNMTDDQKTEVVNKANTIRDKKDMWKFVMEINSMKN
ncbi:hypothetical protein [Ruminococcus sp. JL13D9]|uniref:hypothetical protein n=1 Tax=Ruminococcus sp. JL13D9 TaxID=3233381 RepID=UPI00389A860F